MLEPMDIIHRITLDVPRSLESDPARWNWEHLLGKGVQFVDSHRVDGEEGQ